MTQDAFAAAVLDPSVPLPQGLIDPKGRPAPLRFDVYRNNVAVGLVRALEDGFPVVRKLVGETFFAAMALVHLRAHPPRGPVLMNYGSDFPFFLAAFPPVSHLGYLPDVAQLEWLMRESYHAADASPVAAGRIAALTVPDLLDSRLRLAPSLRLLRSHWPVHAIWRANAQGGPAPVMQAEDVLVLRAEYDPLPQLCPPGAAAVIDALREGKRLAEALALSPDCDAGALLTLLLQGQAIVEIDS